MSVQAMMSALTVLGATPSGQSTTNPYLPAPDTSNRTDITTSDNPQTIIAADPTGRFLIKAGTYTGVTLSLTGDGVDILCEPGVIFEGSNANIAFLYGTADNVTFRGWDDNNRITVQNYKQTSAQTTCLQMGPNGADSWGQSTGWTVGYVDVVDSGRVGLRVGNSSYLGYCSVTGSTELGVAGGGLSSSGNESIIEYCTFQRNNASNADPGFEGGESKFVGTWFIIRYCTFQGAAVHTTASTTPNATHDGYGIWLDVDCDNYLIHDNTVQDIYRGGIILEISGKGIVHSNTIRRVGFKYSNAFDAAWGSTFGSAIQVAAAGIGPSGGSPAVEIYSNFITDCYEGITVYWEARGHWQRSGTTGSEHGVQDLSVHNNTLLRCGPSGMIYAISAWASGQSYVVGVTTERYDASHRTFNNRIYRCILAHTSANGVNEPSGTSASNTWWKYQGIIPTDTSSNVLWTTNSYTNCGSSDSHVGNAADFYRTGTFPNFAAWQAAGQDTGGSSTGSPGYIGS